MFKPIYAVAAVAGLVGSVADRLGRGRGRRGRRSGASCRRCWPRPSGAEQIARLEALGSWTRRLADLLASGAASSLDAALAKSAAVAPAAIAGEVRALAARIGPQGTRTALLAFARDMADPVSDEVVMSLILQLRHGGRGLAQVLRRLAAQRR